MTRFNSLVCGLITIVGLSSSARATTLYAKVSATGSGSCGNWANACTLGGAIAIANSGDEIWVKAGTYPPFDLKQGVKIIGGFAGTETAASQSNPVTSMTIVDGGGVERCVSSENHTSATVLRGFIIRNGYDGDNRGGGGLMLWDSSATIVQCTFENNRAEVLGGAVVVSGSMSQFINCIFRNNGSIPGYPVYEGGAVVVLDGWMTFTNCLFYNNSAWQGGAIAKWYWTYAFFNNCTLADNHATATHGGAINDYGGDIYIRNSILWGNTRSRDEAPPPPPVPDQIYNTSGYTWVWYSDVERGWTGTGNIDADPLFFDPVGGNYQIPISSPCTDVGLQSLLPRDWGDLDWDNNVSETIPKDLARKSRVFNSVVDMGAYEDHTIQE